MLLELLIAASCASGEYNQACQKALEAGSKQTGLYQNMEKAENYAKQRATATATETFGATPVAVAGTGAKIFKDKAVTYSVKPNDLLSIDRITTKVWKGSGSLNFEWRF